MATVQKEDVKRAFRQLHTAGYAAKYESTKWDVIDPETHQRFPPKEVLRVAKRLAGDEAREPTGGAPTNDRLRDLGFDVLLKKDLEHSAAEVDIRSVISDEEDETTKTRLVNARLGQGEFREALLESWQRKCALTECSFEPLLKASHIKPWRESTNAERLDPNNGLLLAAHVDALFDRFLISFSDDGVLLTSTQLPQGLLKSLGMSSSAKVKLKTGNRKYLAWHRAEFSRLDCG